MPNLIDRCASCRLNVYLEDNVTGACGCPERDFRILLFNQKTRNAQGNPPVPFQPSAAQPPPQLDPMMLMSAAGRSELAAAQQLCGRAMPPTRPTATRTASSRLDDQVVDAMFDEPPMATDATDIDLGDGDWTGTWEEPRRHNARVASMGMVDLAAMWMQGTGIPYDPTQLAASDHLDDFSFDTGDDWTVDASSYPRGGGGGGSGRFRVDGPLPARAGFDRTLINNQGPMTEAGRARGFPVLRERDPMRGRPPPPPPITEPQAIFERVRGSAPPPREPARAPSALQQARALQDAARSRPTAYDRLRTNPFK